MSETIRILIADDTLPARQGLKALLTMMPRVEVIGQATNGQEAVQLVDMLHPDVVLMDIQMPVMDGLEATRQIKSRWPEVKVIALTMYSSYQSEAYAVGVDMFLRKGCASKSLQDAILNNLAE
jgi:DNA-binding NarL/FixJ family response regulator